MAAPLRTKSRWQTLVHRTKIAGKSGRRWLDWMLKPDEFPPPRLAAEEAAFPTVAWRHSAPIVRTAPDAQPLYEEGKLHNLRLAQPSFDGLLLSPDRVFSFWRTLGEASLARGFRYGMELQGGCVVPAVGGGICMLSNALFRMAVELGFTIVERHGHSVSAVPLAPGETWGLDATVFYPYVDLRFVPTVPVRLGMNVSADRLVIEARTEQPLPVKVTVQSAAEGHERQGVDEYRTNRLVRLRFVDEQLVGEETIAENRKRLLHPEEPGRSCLTCGDTACQMRPKDLPSLIRQNDLHRRP